MSGVEHIIGERLRQVHEEGYTPEHDDAHTGGELALAAAAYALPYTETGKRRLWPFSEPLKITHPRRREDRIGELVKAGALIAAEIDRLERLAP